MVGASTLKFYNTETIEDYQDLIVDLHQKGKNKLAKELFNRLNKAQIKDFLCALVLQDKKTELIHFIKLL